MPDLEKKFTSTGVKFLYHLDRLQEFQAGEPVRPITLHVMPESSCSLRCAFCSVVKRTTHERLDFELISKFEWDSWHAYMQQTTQGGKINWGLLESKYHKRFIEQLKRDIHPRYSKELRLIL